MNRLQEIEARLAAIANEIEQRGAELTAEQLTAFETEVNNLKTERAGLVAAAEQRNNLLNAIYSPDMLVGRFHYRIDTLLPIDFTGKKGH